jgi:glycosyltransferase involved in cell wall biosynthesis
VDRDEESATGAICDLAGGLEVFQCFTTYPRGPGFIEWTSCPCLSLGVCCDLKCGSRSMVNGAALNAMYGSDTLHNDVGFVVIGRNEGRRLIDCLQSIEAQGRVIVYVDSGSTDGSTAAAERHGAMVVELDSALPFTAARARNEGFSALLAQSSNVRFVQFIDGDCLLDPLWTETAKMFLNQREDVAVVCGRRRERFPETSVFNLLCDIEWNTPIGEALACGGDSMVRVTAFREVEGFRAELMAGEEPEMCSRLRKRGWRICRIDGEMTRHDAAMTRFSQWWRRAVRGGYAEAEISIRLGSFDFSQGELRQVARSVIWGGVLPATIAVASIVHPVALLGLLLYPFQIIRIAWRRGARARVSWIYAFFMMVAKFAQLQGVAKCVWSLLLRRPASLIEYKRMN